MAYIECLTCHSWHLPSQPCCKQVQHPLQPTFVPCAVPQIVPTTVPSVVPPIVPANAFFGHLNGGQFQSCFDLTQPTIPVQILEFASQYHAPPAMMVSQPVMVQQPAQPVMVQQPVPYFLQPPTFTVGAPFPSKNTEAKADEQFFENIAAQSYDALSEQFDSVLKTIQINERVFDDFSLKQKFENFLDSAEEAFNTCVTNDEEIYEYAASWVRRVEEKLAETEIFPQRNYNITNAFLDVFNSLLNFMERVGQKASPSDLKLKQEERLGHKMIAKCQAIVDYLLRSNFDTQKALESTDFDLGEVKDAVRNFKKTQVFPLCLSSLQRLTHKQIKDENLETVRSLLKALREGYAFWEDKIGIDRLQLWTEVAQAMAQLMKQELKTKRKDGDVKGVAHLFESCLTCLEFLKSDSFDSVGETEFEGYACTRHLQICCLLFKWSGLEGFNEPQSTRNSGNEVRGKNVIRYRCKRMVALGRQAFQLGRFWRHIMRTGIVDLEGCYFVLDHRAEDKKKNQDRKLSGVLFYWVLSSEAAAEELLRLFVAWCETKERRNRVFSLYPDLYRLQQDKLTQEEDQERSIIRQKMVRKLNSMAPEVQYKSTSVRNKSGAWVVKKTKIPPTKQQVYDHEREEARIRSMLCGEGRWSQEALDSQKLMYHFTFALKNEDEAKAPKQKKSVSPPPGFQKPVSSLPPGYQEHGYFMSIAGC